MDLQQLSERVRDLYNVNLLTSLFFFASCRIWSPDEHLPSHLCLLNHTEDIYEIWERGKDLREDAWDPASFSPSKLEWGFFSLYFPFPLFFNINLAALGTKELANEASITGGKVFLTLAIIIERKKMHVSSASTLNEA